MEAFEFFIPQNIMVGAGTMAKLHISDLMPSFWKVHGQLPHQ